jgi:triosephosphate isomerase
VGQPVKKLIAGNWKMNGVSGSLVEIAALKQLLDADGAPNCDVALCLPATLVGAGAGAAEGSVIGIGGQDCHAKEAGAHTGDISAEMLRDAGATYVIVGHSERRADHGESDGDVLAKTEAALRAGITPIICVGETEEERKSGAALSVVNDQLAGSLPDSVAGAKFVVAYEPVWAIGTGLTPTIADIAEMHKSIRQNLVKRFGDAGANVALLYGGSMKPANAGDILGVEDVDGGLIGGASLKASDFIQIIRAA